MAESSYLWTTNGTGDGAVPYTRTDWSVIARILGWGNGIIPGFLNEFSWSVPNVNTFRVNAGGAIVDGKPYYNSTLLDLIISAPIGAGNSRIDRIVLRASWSAQTVRIYRIEGTDPGANPTAPAIVQNSGVTWDLPLYTIRIDSGNQVTLVSDDRSFVQLDADVIPAGFIVTAMLANASVTSDKLASNSVIAAKLPNNVIDNTKLRDSVAYSVIGRSASNSGDPADIAAAVDGYVLRRLGGALGFGLIGTSSLSDSAVVETKISGFAVTEGKIATGAVSNAKIQDGAVDDLKVGDRIVRSRYRVGGSTINWSQPGGNTYSIGKVQIICGSASGSLIAGPINTPVDVSYPIQTPFTNSPCIILSLIEGPAYGSIRLGPDSPSGFTAVFNRTDTTNNDNFVFTWIAIGPGPA